MAKHLSPQTIDALINQALAIEDEQAQEAGALGFMARAMAQALREAGATLAFGSDWTVAPLSPILGIYAAVTRRTLDGKKPGGWIPEQKISVEEAVRAYTVNGAYVEFAEAAKGTIQTGKLADLVVLDRDIFTIPPEEIAAVKVALTVFDGKVVHRKD